MPVITRVGRDCYDWLGFRFACLETEQCQKVLDQSQSLPNISEGDRTRASRILHFSSPLNILPCLCAWPFKISPPTKIEISDQKIRLFPRISQKKEIELQLRNKVWLVVIGSSNYISGKFISFILRISHFSSAKQSL